MPELPFGSEFSPSQIVLTELLQFCKDNEGNKEELEKKILDTYFYNHGNGSASNQKKLAMNCRLGLKSYGIIDEDCRFTELGNTLYNIKDNEEELYKVFAKHILLNLNGMGFVQTMRDMTQALEKITLETMVPELEQRGITFPSGGKHPSIMRLWLAKAGVFQTKGYTVNEDRVSEILNSENDIEKLRQLTKEQRYFLLALLNTGISDYQSAADIAKLATATYGIIYPQKSLPKAVLNALQAAGYIEYVKATTGRGAKPSQCKPTEQAKKEILDPIVEQLASLTDPKLVEMLTKSLKEIKEEVNSDNTYIKGIALEALAFKLLRILGLDYLATRVRPEATGGNEVDLLFHSSRLIYSRWQIQCKNTSHVSIDYVAREVGIAQVVYSNVIVLITTGTVAEKARRYAAHIMKNSNLNIVFIEGEDIQRIENEPLELVNLFDREAKATMRLKSIDTDNL